MKLIKRFQSGGNLTTAQGLASVFQGINLQQGLSGDARLGNMQVKDGMFNPAPPLYAPMIQTQQNNLLWQTNKQTTIPEENTAQPKSNIQVAQEGEKLQPNRFMDFIKRFFMGPPVEHKPYVQRPQPRNTYKIKEPLEPDVKSDMNTYSGGMLPGITVEAKDLSKPQRFPYGGINVISKPINGGLDTRQRVVVNPFESSDLMAKYGDGDKLPTAPKAKDRYANSQRLYSDNAFFGSNSKYQDGQTTGVVQNTPYSIIPAIITQQIIGNDTIYRETPDQKRFRLRGFPITRTASNTDSNRQEYETMRNRFNTAWGIAKQQEGGELQRRFQKLSPSTPYNRGGQSNTIHQVPEIISKGIDRRWRFDRRENPQGNGRNTISETFFDYYDGGNDYLGDLAPIRGGRTIYASPSGNDTIYWNQPTDWIQFPSGLMPIGKSQPGAKENFFKNLKRPLVKHQTGGLVERTDNTSVASRPQLINNKIPYGAGKGPAADSPMRLFNDPYVGIGMMAMAPIASRGFSSTKPASVNKFSTYIKGLPKSMSTSDKVAIGAGTVGGVALGYDDNHNQYVREGLRKMGIEFPQGLNPKGDSIYNDKHIFDNLLKYMLEYK